jgi:hypothetical protein
MRAIVEPPENWENRRALIRQLFELDYVVTEIPCPGERTTVLLITGPGQ